MALAITCMANCSLGAQVLRVVGLQRLVYLVVLSAELLLAGMWMILFLRQWKLE